MKFILKMPHQNWRIFKTTGDFDFAQSLLQAFERLGHSADIRVEKHWNEPQDPQAIGLVMWGSRKFEPAKGERHLLWLRDGAFGNFASDQDIARADHTFIASRYVTELQKWGPNRSKVSLLLPCVDPAQMFVGPKTSRRGVVFVDDRQAAAGQSGPMIDLGNDATLDLTSLWNDRSGFEFMPTASPRIMDFDARSDDFRRAAIVMFANRHGTPTTGYIACGLLEALACGAPIICDRIAGLPQEFRPFVAMCRTADEFRAAIQRIAAEGPEMQKQRVAFAAQCSRFHTFDARAAQIVDIARGLFP